MCLCTRSGRHPESLTDAVCVCHAFPGHTVPPQALVHVIAGVTVLHPVVSCRGDNEEYVPDSGTEQPTSHEAVHPAKKTLTDIQKTEQVRASQTSGPPLYQLKQVLPVAERGAPLNMNKTISKNIQQDATNAALELDTSDYRNSTH